MVVVSEGPLVKENARVVPLSVEAEEFSLRAVPLRRDTSFLSYGHPRWGQPLSVSRRVLPFHSSLLQASIVSSLLSNSPPVPPDL